MKSCPSELISWGIGGKLLGSTIFSIAWKLLPANNSFPHGLPPTAISMTRHPSDQMSALRIIYLFASTSGAIQASEPLMAPFMSAVEMEFSKSFAQPKSVSFTIFFVSSTITFAPFRSQWITLLLCRYTKPVKIYFI